MKIANKNAREFVQRQHPFEGSNLWAQYFCVNSKDPSPGQSGYVVYSYGVHYPMLAAVHINGQDHWFANKDKYSPSTSRHMQQCRPEAPLNWLSTVWMIHLVSCGYIAIVKDRILEGVAA